MFIFKEFTTPYISPSNYWFGGGIITDGDETEHALVFKFDHEPSEAEIQPMLDARLAEMNAPKPVLIPKTDFMARFTNKELGGLFLSEDENVINLVAEWQNPNISNVDLILPLVVDGVNYLEAVGLIGAGRAAEILRTT